MGCALLLQLLLALAPPPKHSSAGRAESRGGGLLAPGVRRCTAAGLHSAECGCGLLTGDEGVDGREAMRAAVCLTGTAAARAAASPLSNRGDADAALGEGVPAAAVGEGEPASCCPAPAALPAHACFCRDGEAARCGDPITSRPGRGALHSGGGPADAPAGLGAAGPVEPALRMLPGGLAAEAGGRRGGDLLPLRAALRSDAAARSAAAPSEPPPRTAVI